MVALDGDYFRALETPRMAALAPNLIAAAFPLMKLMPARYILDRAVADGAFEARMRIVETTSGTFGMALALLSAARGYRLTLVSASSLVDAKYKARLDGLGAQMIITEDHAGDGDQLARLQRLDDIRRAEPNCFWPRQYDNPGNALAYARLAEQLVQTVGEIDCLVGCVGSGGSLCGTAMFLRAVFPHLIVIAVDTHRSILFGQPAGKRLLRGLGNSILPGNLRHDLIDEVHWVGGYPAFSEARRLLREHGIFQGPTSAAAALVGRWAASTRPGARIAVIMPDEGHRYAETVFDDAWLGALPGWPCSPPSEPREVTIVESGSEADWMRFIWARRSLDRIVDDEVKNEGRFR
ncbi:pyridoxal-5-phosphate-dependent protein subunit beta [Bosea sp. Root483D1]|uniref:PLP-dependent cysteine synthase family protein n=1 Tax=Bosea sp. Root483D1 TaxID=1736544 RepID=UPI00070D1041|nr:PLP-dependent cysteine synthase family protein [Bosea sp. Root483D1]KRE11451.1 pyridoxal-5-phosphate-dependent protein subunit beta [Bosea sp. Root483D1]